MRESPASPGLALAWRQLSPLHSRMWQRWITRTCAANAAARARFRPRRNPHRLTFENVLLEGLVRFCRAPCQTNPKTNVSGLQLRSAPSGSTWNADLSLTYLQYVGR